MGLLRSCAADDAPPGCQTAVQDTGETTERAHPLRWRPSMRLLLVEDDPSLRSTLERTLGRRGLSVEACADGNQALARWKAAPPDVLVLDLSLPGLDGLDVLQA